MSTPPHVPHAPSGFPDDNTGADVFVREFPTAVAPADREYLMTKPPLFILRVEDEGPEYEDRVRRVVEALRQPLDNGGKLVPYARVDAQSDSPLLTVKAGDRLGLRIPRHMTPDRFPQFRLLRAVFEDILARASGAGPESGARALRDSAYRKRVAQGGLPGFLWALGGGETPPLSGGYGWLVSLVWLPLTRTFPRWWWARRKTRQLIRPAARRESRWLGADQHVERGRENLFRVLDDLSQRQVPRLGPGHTNRPEALFELERLLVRALLEDLSDPSTGRVLPRRRRRTARPVLLVPIPRPATPTREAGQEAAQEPAGQELAERDAVERTERFLAAFRAAQQTARAPGPLVIAVGRPSEELMARLGGHREIALGPAAHLLHERDDGSPVLVPLRSEPFDRPGLPIREVRPKRFKAGWETVTAVVAGGTALALVAALLVLRSLLPDSPGGCVGGTEPVAESARSGQIATDAPRWYASARAAIDAQNEKAVELARSGRTVRTVVAFVSNKPTSGINTLFDGTIPELRGIAMWQEKLNESANADRKQVPLLVKVVETGAAFQNAEAQARKLVEEIREDKVEFAYQRVIGVLGYAQSRNETKAALKVLDEAKILAIGTTATADEMLGEANYWPLTPLNSREAAIEADFAASSGIVASGDGCVPARRAIVIESHGDLYSRSLAQQFVNSFPGQKLRIDFTQEDRGPAADVPPGMPSYTVARQLATRVCDEIGEKQPPTVIYWSARARDFTAFVSAFDTQGTCTAADVTVLGGNELTNVSQTGVFNNKRWLRLYYSAHRLPVSDHRASTITKTFVSAYNDFVRRTTEGEDPWVEDGHSAVAYDAFHVLSDVADSTYGANPRAQVADMQNFFRVGGVTFGGATGYIDYAKGVNQPPADKTLVLLRQIGQHPRAVAVCGAYDQGQSSADQGRPCVSAPR